MYIMKHKRHFSFSSSFSPTSLGLVFFSLCNRSSSFLVRDKPFSRRYHLLVTLLASKERQAIACLLPFSSRQRSLHSLSLLSYLSLSLLLLLLSFISWDQKNSASVRMEGCTSKDDGEEKEKRNKWGWREEEAVFLFLSSSASFSLSEFISCSQVSSLLFTISEGSSFLLVEFWKP